MNRLFIPRSSLLLLLSFLFVLALASSVRADTKVIIATPTPYSTAYGMSGFTLTYADANGNGLLDTTETILAMTNITFQYAGDGVHTTITVLGGPVREIPIYDAAVSPYTNGTAYIFAPNGTTKIPEWQFSSITTDPNYLWMVDSEWDAHWWTYSEVPCPPPVYLFGSGLMGLALARLRKRWRK
jgi:hypothetical protein